MSNNFIWKGLAGDVYNCVASCLHYTAMDSVSTIPLPLGHDINSIKLNEITHFYLFYIGSFEDDSTDILIHIYFPKIVEGCSWFLVSNPVSSWVRTSSGMPQRMVDRTAATVFVESRGDIFWQWLSIRHRP